MVSTMSEYAKRKEEIYKYLGGACVICGTTENLDIDHKIAEDKKFDISSNWSRSWDFLVVELDKCQLLCRPHHREKTAAEGDNTGGGRNKWSEIQHGKVWAYAKYGCRCNLCKEAKRNSGKK